MTTNIGLGKRVQGLDTLRLALALCVVFGHIGLPIAADPSSHTLPWSAFAAIYANAFNGPAAVVCFFVISGFCIHYPYRNQKTLELLPYFSRRHIRIWVPIAAAVIAAKCVGLRVVVLGDSILWSLIAEEIYYLLYPILRWLRLRWSWLGLIVMAYAAAILMAATDVSAMNYPSFGIGGNWILGLPCWLLGCHLAQTSDGWGIVAPRVSLMRVWTLRTIIVAVGTLCSIARFHLAIGYPWSLTVCSPLIYYWLHQEIVYYRDHAPIQILESAGQMTYSIYLTHLLASRFLTNHVGPISEELLPRVLYFVGVLTLTASFYFTIERPSHRLARATANWILTRSRKRELQISG